MIVTAAHCCSDCPGLREDRLVPDRAALGRGTAAVAATAVAEAWVGCWAGRARAAAQASTARPAGTTAASPILWGTPDIILNHVAAENAAGIKSATFEISWASFEPSPGWFSTSNPAAQRSLLAAYQAAGSTVTLGLGMENTRRRGSPNSPMPPTSMSTAMCPPKPTSRSPPRSATPPPATSPRSPATSAERFLVSCHRINSGGDPEMLYPGDHDGYWAFSHAALTGQGLPAGMTASRYLDGGPGEADLTKAASWTPGPTDRAAWA